MERLASNQGSLWLDNNCLSPVNCARVLPVCGAIGHQDRVMSRGPCTCAQALPRGRLHLAQLEHKHTHTRKKTKVHQRRGKIVFLQSGLLTGHQRDSLHLASHLNTCINYRQRPPYWQVRDPFITRLLIVNYCPVVFVQSLYSTLNHMIEISNAWGNPFKLKYCFTVKEVFTWGGKTIIVSGLNI